MTWGIVAFLVLVGVVAGIGLVLAFTRKDGGATVAEALKRQREEQDKRAIERERLHKELKRLEAESAQRVSDLRAGHPVDLDWIETLAHSREAALKRLEKLK